MSSSFCRCVVEMSFSKCRLSSRSLNYSPPNVPRFFMASSFSMFQHVSACSWNIQISCGSQFIGPHNSLHLWRFKRAQVPAPLPYSQGQRPGRIQRPWISALSAAPPLLLVDVDHEALANGHDLFAVFFSKYCWKTNPAWQTHAWIMI